MKIMSFFLLIILFKPIQCLAFSNNIVISQIMIGQDKAAKNEFVELYNPTQYDINLEGYSLKKKTASGRESLLVGPKSFQGIIKANSYFLIASQEYANEISADIEYSTQNSLAKNNTVLIYNKDNVLIESIGYGDIKNNTSIKRNLNDNSFFVVKNNIVVRNSQNQTSEISNKENKEEDKKETTIATVFNLPGNMGVQFFYVVNENNEIIEIYNYYKKFPKLEIGNLIEIKGEKIESNNKVRIKTKKEEDIKILKNNQEIIEPSISKIIDLNRSYQYVKIQGTIIQNRSNKIYLHDQSQEMLLDIKTGTGINKKILIEGQEYQIQGVLIIDEDNKKLQIRSQDDIESLNNKETKMPGISLNQNLKQIPANNKEGKIKQYIIAIVLFYVIYYIIERKIRKN